MIKKRVASMVLLVGGAGLLSACGGGGSGGVPVPPAPYLSIEGQVIDGRPVVGATVCLSDTRGSLQPLPGLCAGPTDLRGRYVIQVSTGTLASDTPLAVIATRGADLRLVSDVGRYGTIKNAAVDNRVTFEQVQGLRVTETRTAEYVLRDAGVREPTDEQLQNISYLIKAYLDGLGGSLFGYANTLELARAIAAAGAEGQFVNAQGGLVDIDARLQTFLSNYFGGQLFMGHDDNGYLLMRFAQNGRFHQWQRQGLDADNFTLSASEGRWRVTGSRHLDVGTLPGGVRVGHMLGSEVELDLNASVTPDSYLRSEPLAARDLSGASLRLLGSERVLTFNPNATGQVEPVACAPGGRLDFRWRVEADGTLVIDQRGTCESRFLRVNRLGIGSAMPAEDAWLAAVRNYAGAGDDPDGVLGITDVTMVTLKQATPPEPDPAHRVDMRGTWFYTYRFTACPLQVAGGTITFDADASGQLQAMQVRGTELEVTWENGQVVGCDLFYKEENAPLPAGFSASMTEGQFTQFLATLSDHDRHAVTMFSEYLISFTEEDDGGDWIMEYRR